MSADASLRSFRTTVSHSLAPLVRELLSAEGYRFEQEPFSPHCWRLLEEPAPLGSSLAAFFGLVYIQDRSSMLPPLALAPEEGQSVLDMCASPGSKTGFLCQLVGPAGFVLANEVSHSRLFTLRSNLRACNFIQAATCSYEGQNLPLRPASFDAIQLDPPCSGWGTVEKNPKVMELWKGDKVKPLVCLQRLLLKKAASLLRKGGHVVYSTCTTNSEENEMQVKFAEEELGLRREPLEVFPGFVCDEKDGSQGTLRIDGEKSNAQGFFVAKLRKEEDVEAPAEEEAPAQKKRRPKGRIDAQKSQQGEVPLSMLSCESLDPSKLSGGKAGVFSGTVRYLPEASEFLLPDGFVWQGAQLGKMGGGGFVADRRLRVLVPESGRRIVFEETSALRALLSGQTLRSDLGAGEASLWWRDLPLGAVSVKNGRIIASFQR